MSWTSGRGIVLAERRRSSNLARSWPRQPICRRGTTVVDLATWAIDTRNDEISADSLEEVGEGLGYRSGTPGEDLGVTQRIHALQPRRGLSPAMGGGPCNQGPREDAFIPNRSRATQDRKLAGPGSGMCQTFDGSDTDFPVDDELTLHLTGRKPM